MPAQALTGMRSEIALLLCCARTSMDDEQADRARTLLQEPLDWVYLLGAAYEHSIIPLLYHSLESIGPDAIPGRAWDWLKAEYYGNARHNLFLIGELTRLLRVFEANDLRALPYKGPALAVVAYGDATFREFGDLDILIQIGDFYRARDLLAAEGYSPFLPAKPQHDDTQLRFSGDYNFVREDGQVHLDLQWTALSRFFAFPLCTESLWKRRAMISINGTTVPSISAQDLLLILCAHGTKHLWKRLGWVCDVAELIRRQAIDWQAALDQARAVGGERMLLLGLFLAHDLLQAPLPDDIYARACEDRTIQSLASQIRRQIIEGDDRKPRLSLFHLRARERMRDKLRYCVHWAMTPIDDDLRVWSLPRQFYFLYYPVHIGRLIFEYGSQALRSIARHCATPFNGQRRSSV